MERQTILWARAAVLCHQSLLLETEHSSVFDAPNLQTFANVSLSLCR